MIPYSWECRNPCPVLLLYFPPQLWISDPLPSIGSIPTENGGSLSLALPVFWLISSTELRDFTLSFQVLTFKEITWQTLRIEADATDNGDQDLVTTPLRLITNQGRIQISLKRRVSLFSVLMKTPIFYSPRKPRSWYTVFLSFFPSF